MRRSATLVAALAILVGVVGGCGGDEEGATTAATTETGPMETGNAEAGKDVFASAGCGGCHTLSEAGSSGTVGPKLDGRKLSLERVKEQVENGGGAMPAFKDQLTDRQIADVAAFVSQASQS